MSLSRTWKAKVRKALAEAGQAPIEWEAQRMAEGIGDEKSDDLREMLLDAWTGGCKPLREKDAWDSIQEELITAMEEYPDEEDAIKARFGKTTE